jgi:small-conductance mechanosensitive channel
VGGLGEAWEDAREFLDRHPLLDALVIVAVFLALARLTDWVISGFLRRLTRRSETTFDDRLVKILHRPTQVTVLMVGLIIATNRLDLDDDVERVTVLIITTLLVVVWAAFGRRFFALALSAMRRSEERFSYVQPATEPVLANALAVVTYLVAAYAILLVWDVNITGLVASAGILGLALSFAAQDTLSNLFAGVAILSDRPYKIGDFIILDSGERCEVTHIGLRSTRLLTRDDVEVSIPNGVMGASKIVNEAGGPPGRYRIRTSVGVAYGSDIDEVDDILYRVAAEHPKTLADPEPRARFRTFGESSLDFELLCWIADPADRGLVLHELNAAIYREFASAGVRIPFPQRDIHVVEMPRDQPLPEGS